MKLDAVQLARDMVAINSVSQRSNAEVSDFLEETLKRCAFEVERLEFVDEDGNRKVSLVGKKGEGTDGFGLFSGFQWIVSSTQIPCPAWRKIGTHSILWLKMAAYLVAEVAT